MKTYATVCSGVEGCSLALDGMDWQPVFFSEIEPFPCAVLKSHFPNVPNLGDMSKISYNKEEGIISNGTIRIVFDRRLDLLAGGTPCQDFSVAGLRRGGQEGSGTRSSLMWQWLRLVAELRPRAILWENVVGALSTNDGRDFAQFVAEVSRLGYCVAWRVLDAQHTRTYCPPFPSRFYGIAMGWPQAIPQRRRRIFLVGCLDAQPFDLAKILFEPRSIIGDTPARKRTGQEAAKTARNGDSLDVGMVGHTRQCEGFFDNVRNGFPLTGEDVGFTVCSKEHYQGVVEGISYGIGNGQINCACNPAKEIAQTLDCMDDVQKIMRVCGNGKDVMNCLSSDDGTQSGQDYVSNSVVECYDRSTRARNPESNGDVSPTLLGFMGTGGCNDPFMCFEHHGQDARCTDLDGKPCPTLGTTASNHPLQGNNPLVCEVTPFIKTAHATGKDGEGERWEQGEVVGTRNVFDNGEKRTQEVIVEGVDGYNQSLTGSVSPTVRAKSADADHIPLCVSNSNGGDVMPTINANESKLGGDNQHINGGGVRCP